MFKKLSIIGLLFMLSACNSPAPVKKKVGPEPGRHKITITRLALSDSDFTLTAFGNPRDIDLFVAKDGARKKIGTIDGYRGPKDQTISFEIDYDPVSRYEFVLEETAMMGQAKKWSIFSEKPGGWPFSQSSSFGAGSSITFVDTKVR